MLIFISAVSSYPQGTFRNLDFESASIILDPSSPYYPHAVNATNALPGWRVLGGVAYPDVLYNTVSLGASAISIFDDYNMGYPPIQGHYSVYLQDFGIGGDVGIAQSGRIPTLAQSLTFWSYAANFQISFQGQVIPYAGIGSGSGFFGMDISAFAGQTGELRFSGGGYLDNIQFSTQPIPEPGVFGLFALGALLLGRRALVRRQ